MKHNIPAWLTNSRGHTVRQPARRPTNNASTSQSKACSASGICQRSSVIFKTTCKICGQFYVCMQQRKLHDRAHEHVAVARERSRSSALGEHYQTQHPVPKDTDGARGPPTVHRLWGAVTTPGCIAPPHRRSNGDPIALTAAQPQGRTLGNGLPCLISLFKNFFIKKTFYTSISTNAQTKH